MISQPLFAIFSAGTVLQSIPAFLTAALARVKRSKSATAGWLCQNKIDFNDIATLRQVWMSNIQRLTLPKIQVPTTLVSMRVTENKGMDITTFAEPLTSRGSDCALTGRFTVEWSLEARTRRLCGHNRMYGTATASA
jgi:hypothetical protein